ncbi:unnamed protein product [Adineta ricciae]|uniref:Smr domain-containing protein n=2 Tax=Adineta ricciae TaxID=249248 RepID=A0A814E5P5_ADIRI|nr:unnamed protein product [Adineta ricciae]
MTTESGNDHIDGLQTDNQSITDVTQSPCDESNRNSDVLSTTTDNKSKDNPTNETEENDNNNDDDMVTTTMQHNNGASEQQQETQAKESAEDDHRSKRSFTSKAKYSYHRAPYYANGYSYGPAAPYYFYPIAPMNEKPIPLMVIPTQPATTASDNSTSNSATVSPQNLPPRLRQTSATENDSNAQQSSSQAPTASPSQAPTSNGRRHRSILPRGSCNYYSPHPPPLMATPPGVLFPYPSSVHQPGHIAYNIRTPDELELLAFQQQLMNMPPSVLWPPGSAYPHLPPYSMYESSPYMYNNPSLMNSNNSLLNPEAAEWIPISTDTDASSSDNNILIDDEINFPPLNNHRTEENNSEPKASMESSQDTPTVTKIDDLTKITTSKVETSTTCPLSSQDDNKPVSLLKAATVTYSTVILQTPAANKSMKTHQGQQQSTNSAQVSSLTKQKQQQQPSAARNMKDNSSRQRPYPSNRNNFNRTRILPSNETTKAHEQVTDDWIEVKSKKTKKFDRSANGSHKKSSKFTSDEQTHKTISPPSSLSSADERTTATCSSEEEDDDDDDDDVNNLSDDKLPLPVETKTDYNQLIINDIHKRLDNDERLLILMRGCPGSGKSTLAKSLNHGYNGQILSTDGYYKDHNNLNEYFFDPSKHEDAHYYYNSRLASDAFKQNISPIIIDNTNVTTWEMKPYVLMGKEAGYNILLLEPQTPWRYKAHELVKRNVHNLSLQRIQDMLDRFEHNVTVQSILDQTKTSVYIPCSSAQVSDQHQTDTESIDPILTSKKFYETIDDSNILDDVRLCINDMILFLTSTFYQASQPFAMSFSDLSLIPSSPTTPTTSYSLFHRSMSRFPSTTTSQEHSFTNEHFLRLPSTSYSRCLESLSPPSSNSSSLAGKKRRKSKNKQSPHQSDEMLFNTNNNNNYRINTEDNYSRQFVYNVCLPEDCTDFVVIDEQNQPDCSHNFIREEKTYRDHSSTLPVQQKPNPNKQSQLLNIIRDELVKPSTEQRSLVSTKHIAVQCSAVDLKQDITNIDCILIGHLSAGSIASSPISPPPGFIERGIQVDLNESHIDSLADLIEFYSDSVLPEIVKQFYELCNADIPWARTQIDEYLRHPPSASSVPTLRQLSFNALNQWNEQIKHSNPSFDTISIGDILRDINNGDIFDELTIDDEPDASAIPISDTNHLTIPWPVINSIQELYGELPTKESFHYDGNGLSLPLDDELSFNIYQSLQRFLGVSNQITKPVNEKKVTKENKKINKQQRNLPKANESSTNSSTKKGNTPSLQEIMDEELNYIQTQKAIPKRQLDYASQHKLKELERQFPTISSDVIHEIFLANESEYELTLACISSMLDETASITPTPKSQRLPLATTTVTKPSLQQQQQAKVEPYEIARRDALNYASKRKDCYLKADQANRHGMTGVASYYINQACEQTRLMRDANRIVFEHLSRKRLVQFRQTHRLDLHELHADEALNLFKQVEQELCEGNRRTTPKSIEIITGYGKNSPYGGGSGKIRSAILAYLRQKNYK